MIDLVHKTGRIEYVDLRTSSDKADLAYEGLMEIDKATDVDEYYSQMEITDKKIYNKGNKLHAVLSFTYENQQELFDLLYISRHPDGYLAYPILELEKVATSNGKLTEEAISDQEVINLVRWDGDINEIQLTLKYRESKQHKVDVSVKLADYWND